MNNILDQALTEILKNFMGQVEEILTLNASFLARRGEQAIQVSHDELLKLDNAVRTLKVSSSSEFIYALVTLKTIIPDLLETLEGKNPYTKEPL